MLILHVLTLGSDILRLRFSSISLCRLYDFSILRALGRSTPLGTGPVSQEEQEGKNRGDRGDGSGRDVAEDGGDAVEKGGIERSKDFTSLVK